MLTNVSIENFKGLSRLDLDLSRVNVLIGENGTGKSSVLQAISILKQSKGTTGIQTNLPYANLGQLPTLIPSGLSARIGVRGKSALVQGPNGWSDASFELELRLDANGYAGQRGAVSITGGPNISSEWTRYGLNKVHPLSVDIGPATFNLGGTNTIGQVFKSGGYQIRNSTPEIQKQSQVTFDWLQELSSIPSATLERYQVIAPMRGITEPAYQLTAQPVTEYTPRQGTAQSGAALAANLVYNRKTSQTISEWEKEILGVGVHAELRQGPIVEIQNPEKGTEFVNEGFGANQLLFLLERLANVPPDSTLGIEEPEIHLHPAAQFTLGKWFGKLSTELGKQLLITTHSPDLLSGLLASVRQKLLPSPELTVWFLDRSGSEVRVSKSTAEDSGRVAGAALSAFVAASLKQVSEFF